MNKTVQKIISLIMIGAIICGVPVNTAAASQTDNLAYGLPMIPVINVDGIATRDLYRDIGTAQEKQIFYPPVDDLTATLKKLIQPVMRLLVDKNWNAFGDKLISGAKELIGDIACNPDGLSKDNVSIKDEFYFPAGYQYDRNLYFSYDWRLDPMDNSKKLNDYIQFVLEKTGSDKVALIPNSMGCTVVMAYLQQFGTDDVESVVMRSSAFQGVSLVGELFIKQLQINKHAVTGYIRGFLKEDSQSKQIGLMITVLDMLGIVDLVISIVDELLMQLTDRVYDEMLIETFGYMPGVWSLVPDLYFEKAKTTMLDSEINAELIRKIDYYHYEVQSKSKEILQDAMNSGVTVALISNYNLYGCPITENPDAQTDFLIDTVYTSGGATCAPLKSTLGSTYVQAVDCGHNHISPDNIIDASTCMFPEYTWFVKGMIHTNFNSDYNELVNWILSAETQPDIFSNAGFPQYLQLNMTDNTLSPVQF